MVHALIRPIRIVALAALLVPAVCRSAGAGEVTCLGPTQPNGALASADHLVFATGGIAVEPNGGEVRASGSGAAQVSLRYARAEPGTSIHLGIAATPAEIAAQFSPPKTDANAALVAIVTLYGEPHGPMFIGPATLTVRLSAQARAPANALLAASDAVGAAPLSVRTAADGLLTIDLPSALPACSKVLVER